MSWDNRKQRRKFEKEWKIKEAWYRSLGMSEYTIVQIRSVDEELYKSERRYHRYTMPFDFEKVDQYDNDIDERIISEKFLEEITVNIDTYQWYSRFWWIEELENSIIAARAKMLSMVDLLIITMYVYEGYDQTEIAEFFGVSQSSVSQKISTIRKFLLRPL